MTHRRSTSYNKRPSKSYPIVNAPPLAHDPSNCVFQALLIPIPNASKVPTQHNNSSSACSRAHQKLFGAKGPTATSSHIVQHDHQPPVFSASKITHDHAAHRQLNTPFRVFRLQMAKSCVYPITTSSSSDTSSKITEDSRSHLRRRTPPSLRAITLSYVDQSRRRLLAP
jgi:hypothetical protein